jgi:hypothetical protein
MSKIASNAIQIGESGTISQNFIITQPTTPDGSLIIQRGTLSSPGAVICKINADGGVNNGGPCFSAYPSTSTSLPANAYAKMNFALEEFDIGGCYDAPNSKFLPNMAGYYLISGQMQINTQLASVAIGIYKNGSLFKQGINASSQNSSTISVIVYLNGVSDYVEAWGYTSVAQGINTSPVYSYFQGYLLRAA